LRQNNVWETRPEIACDIDR